MKRASAAIFAALFGPRRVMTERLPASYTQKRGDFSEWSDPDCPMEVGATRTPSQK